MARLSVGRDLSVIGNRERLHQLMPGTLVWVVVLTLAASFWVVINLTLGKLMDRQPEVFVVGTLVLFSMAVFFLLKPSFERAVILMVLTLPLFSSLVFNIGGSLRITYLATLLAVFIAVQHNRMVVFFHGWTGKLLLGFVVYALISVSFTLMIPDVASVTSSGFRGLPIRSVVQFGQLVLMLMAFNVILSYATSRDHLVKLCYIIFWSLVIVTGYGLYEFFAAVFDYPFLNLSTVPSYGMDVAPWAKNLARGFAGIYLPRPRSTVGEPLDFATYLLFSIPFALAAASLTHDKVKRALKHLCAFAASIAFIVANSRAGFVAAVGVSPLVLLFAPSKPGIAKLAGAMAAAALVICFVIFPLIGTAPGFSAPAQYFKENYYFLLSREGRVGSYTEPLEVFRQNPILGVGIGNYPFYLPSEGRSVGETVPMAGSLYTRLLAEFGIIGTALFLGFVAAVLLGLLQVVRKSRDHQLRRVAFAALIAITAYMITRAASVGLFTESYFWVMLGMGVAATRLNNCQQAPDQEASGNQLPPASTELTRYG